MAEPHRLYDILTDDDGTQPSTAPDTATSMLLLALQALSKRTIIALESCFSLITVSLVFIAAYPILTSAPTINQLIGLGVFSVFVLIANFLVLKRRA